MVHLTFDILTLINIGFGEFSYKNRKLLIAAAFVMLHAQDKNPQNFEVNPLSQNARDAEML